MRSNSATEASELEKRPEDHSTKIKNPPDGGLQAWLVVLGGFLTYFATFGTVRPAHFRIAI